MTRRWAPILTVVAVLAGLAAAPGAGAPQGDPADPATQLGSHTSGDRLLARWEAGQDTAYPRQSSPGSVALDVRPGWKNGVLTFAVTADTHTVDLERVALAEAVRLVVGRDTLAPSEAGVLSGHHAESLVRFRVAARPDAFTLLILGVGDQPSRVLRWSKGPDR